MADAAQIAASLSEAQRNLLFYWPKGLFDQRTYLALRRKGLVDSGAVTPLGAQVRAILRAQSQEPSDGE